MMIGEEQKELNIKLNKTEKNRWKSTNTQDFGQRKQKLENEMKGRIINAAIKFTKMTIFDQKQGSKLELGIN